jgi:Putative MetA-pathway of phenol degradation
MKNGFVAIGALLTLFADVAWADTAAAPPDKSQFTLFNPTPTADLRALCADRPTKSNGPCTVDAGQWQLESDLYNVTLQTADGVTTRTELFTNPTLKLGVTDTLDLEVNIAPYELVTIHDSVAKTTTVAGGVGDLFLRAKLNLVGDDGGNISVALFPFVKIPTAPRTIGNGAVEEGLIVPVAFNLPGNWQLTIDPEADAVANATGPGRHLNITSPLSFSYPATKTVTLFVELWGDVNFDPTGTTTQASFDLAAAWIPAKAPNFQLDGGVNLGLNSATPGVQAYVGVSHRF